MVSIDPAYRQKIINRASSVYDLHAKHYGSVDRSRKKFINSALASAYLPGLRDGELIGLPESRMQRAADFRRVACSQTDVSSVPDRVLLIPWGDNRREDGAEQIVDEDSAYSIVDHFNSRRIDLLIDREHQSMGGEWASPDGISPAAGWVKSMEVVANVGIFGKVDWTAWARERINAREYRYLSPVCIVDTKTRKVLYLESVGLTNKPAIPAMSAIVNQASPSGNGTQQTQQTVSGQDPKRAKVIEAAQSVYDGQPTLWKVCKLEAWVNNQLREAGLSLLTEEEKLSLPVNGSYDLRSSDSQRSGLPSGRQTIANTAPVIPSSQRVTIINAAASVYDTDKMLRKLCSLDAWINQQLREAKLSPLTNSEKLNLPANSGQVLRVANSHSSGLRSDRQTIINSAAREYDRNRQDLRKLCSRHAWINGALRENNLRPATEDERRQFAEY